MLAAPPPFSLDDFRVPDAAGRWSASDGCVSLLPSFLPSLFLCVGRFDIGDYCLAISVDADDYHLCENGKGSGGDTWSASGRAYREIGVQEKA